MSATTATTTNVAEADKRRCEHANELRKLAEENGLTDSYLANRFCRYFGADYKYDHDRQLWLAFRDAEHRWRPAEPGEETERAIDNARAFLQEAREIQDRESREKALSFAKYAQNKPGINRVLAIARDLPPIRTKSEVWNADPWLIGARNGIIDLRTGDLLQGSREHLISMSLGVPYDPNAPTPERWIRFLHEIFRHENQFVEELLVRYLQRVCGYILTGLTDEQIWFLLFGPGSNGKSLVLNVWTYILGEYAKTVSFKLFERTTQRPAVGDGTEQLKHKRFVSARETIEGAHLDEQRLKTLTGGDEIPARGLYVPYTEFKPELKLFLCSNHKPRVKDDTFGFWRRVHVITFPNLFVDDPQAANEQKRDDRLEETLKAEAAGILKWMIDGCLEWRQYGLEPPASVKDATAEYQAESDHIPAFVAACCDLATDATCQASPLYEAYQRWAVVEDIGAGERYSAKDFGTRMKKRFKDEHTNAGTVYSGLRLRHLS
jgi:putative DNA primase/helicase